MSDVSEAPAAEELPPPSGGVGHIAFLAGAVAALVGGAAWAVIVRLTDFEIGYVAVGVGLLVGYAMTRTTEARGKQAGIQAAGLAAIGLLFAKMLIVQWVTGPALKEYLTQDQDGVGIAAAWMMREAGTFPEEIQVQLDQLAERDTVPDALWAAMTDAGQAKAAEASDEERTVMAGVYAEGVYRRLGTWRLLWWQVSAFDLLWLFLALSTAYGMLARPTAADGVGDDSGASPPLATG